MILNNGWKVEGKIFGSGLNIKSNDKIIAKITSSKWVKLIVSCRGDEVKEKKILTLIQ